MYNMRCLRFTHSWIASRSLCSTMRGDFLRNCAKFCKTLRNLRYKITMLVFADSPPPWCHCCSAKVNKQPGSMA